MYTCRYIITILELKKIDHKDLHNSAIENHNNFLKSN